MQETVLDFWTEHARPGRVGLIHLDFAPAKLIDWGQKRLTRDGQPSHWVHAFLFIESRNGVPWIAESDASVPWLGVRKPVDGPQINPVTKWSGGTVDRAVVLESGMSDEQYQIARTRAETLTHEHYHYSLIALAGTWISVLRNDLRHRSLLHRIKGMHCGQFVRTCMNAAGVDLLSEDVSLENSAPELIYQHLPVVAEWQKR
jgi:hypothetical protein